MFRHLPLLLNLLILTSPAYGSGKRVIEVIEGRDGGIETADGGPLFGETFVFDEQEGKATLGGGSTGSSGSVSADLRNTVLDFRQLPQPRSGISLAKVEMGSGVSFGVFLRTEKIDSVYFDQDHVAYPNKSRKIAADGPFLNLELTVRRSRKSSADAHIEVLDGSKLLAVASPLPDGSYLAKVKAVHATVLMIRAQDPTSGKVWQGRIAVPIKSAAPDLIEYFGIEINL